MTAAWSLITLDIRLSPSRSATRSLNEVIAWELMLALLHVIHVKLGAP